MENSNRDLKIALVRNVVVITAALAVASFVNPVLKPLFLTDAKTIEKIAFNLGKFLVSSAIIGAVTARYADDFDKYTEVVFDSYESNENPFIAK